METWEEGKNGRKKKIRQWNKRRSRNDVMGERNERSYKNGEKSKEK